MTEPETPASTGTQRRDSDGQDIVLAELVSRVLDRGVVVAGDVTISVAGIDLVYLGLSLRIASTETLLRRSHASSRRSLPAPGVPDDKRQR